MWKVFKKFPKLWYHYKVCTPLSTGTSSDDTQQTSPEECKQESSKRSRCFFRSRSHKSSIKHEESKVEAFVNSQCLFKFAEEKYKLERKFNYGAYYNNEYINIPKFPALGLGLVVFFGLKHAVWNCHRARNKEFRSCPGLSNLLFSVVWAVKGNYSYQLRNSNLPFVANQRISFDPAPTLKNREQVVIAESQETSKNPSESDIRASLKSLAQRYVSLILNEKAEVCLRNKDFRNAFEYFREAGENGLHVALYNLGVCYELGTGVQQDLQKAFHFYMEAGKKGNVEALYNVAVCYMEGIGVEVNETESLCYMLKASESGVREAQTYMGIHHGRLGEYDKAAVLFEKAADQKHSDAEYFLGLCYEHGLGVQCDLRKAADLFSKSSSAGNAEACYRLANYYEQGLGGLKEDVDMASELLHLAANDGYQLAIDRLKFDEDKKNSKEKKAEVRVLSSSSPDLRLPNDVESIVSKASSIASIFHFSFLDSFLGTKASPSSKFYLEDENEESFNFEVTNVKYTCWETPNSHLIHV